MPVLHDHIEQGTEEWLRIRLGVATASNFDRLLTPTGRPSSQIEAFAGQLAAEEISGELEETPTTYWMKRGIDMEPRARAYYELETGHEVSSIGFVTTDCGRIGCSPDGIVKGSGTRTGDAFGLEIKCPSPGMHVSYLAAGRVPDKYVPQVQGSMFVTGLERWDFVSFHPSLPKLIVRVDRDEAYIAKLEAAFKKLLELKEQAIEAIKQGDKIYG